MYHSIALSTIVTETSSHGSAQRRNLNIERTMSKKYTPGFDTVVCTIILCGSIAGFGIWMQVHFGPDVVVGKYDASAYYAAGLAVKTGTFKHIYSINSINPGPNARDWNQSGLYQNAPQVFRYIAHSPGFILPYVYPPPWAGIFAVFTGIGPKWFLFVWLFVCIAGWLIGIMAVCRRRWLRYLCMAAVFWFPGFHYSLIYGGNITTVLIGLNAFGGFGTALATWAKPWIGIAFFARGFNRRSFAIGFVVMVIIGFIVVGSNWELWVKWREPLRLIASKFRGTWWQNAIRIAIGAGWLINELIRRRRKMVLLGAAQLCSPFWEPGYWCWLVPAGLVMIQDYLGLKWIET